MPSLGLILPLRPKTSTIEKRTLTTFPKFTLSSFLNGDFLTGVSTWYSDTFPFREALLNANSAVKNLYGIQGEQIVHNSGQTGDEIPTGGMMVTPESESDSQSDSESGSPAESNETSQGQTSGAETEESETYEDGAIHDVPEASGDVYVTGDTAFGIYYFNLEAANEYITMIDKAQKRLDGVANVYDILVPTSVGICLDEKVQNKSTPATRITLLTTFLTTLTI